MHECYMCKCKPGPFFVWSSSRNFPREKLIDKFNIIDKKYIKDLRSDGFKVCYGCLNKLKE